MVRKLFLRSSLTKSYSICQENSGIAYFGPFKALFGPKLTILRDFDCNFQTPLWIFLIFGTEVVLMVFFEEIILYMPGKFWYGNFWPFKTKIWPFLAKNDFFESFWLITFKRSYEFSWFLLWNFFEFWVFLGNQSYCVLFSFFPALCVSFQSRLSFHSHFFQDVHC